ncbi:hypothetical protein E0485_16530 [Paenibacillus albiflavus]|uniref:DUF2334 domain-containing protein n=1 Tax=Paenibacillus albiflavus TaxID=2545760 RepID=A0A4R4E9L6_9BACL|nr:hypothetical protein [Paenibacillus albiflavus]TCZ75703.1 hypothetical protein E0485_16530 [Paenibacillus albiflavus]
MNLNITHFHKVLILSLMLMLITPSVHVQAAETKPQVQVLLLYDSLAKHTAQEGNVEALKRMLAAYGVQVTFTSIDQYVSGLITKFNKVIYIQNAGDLSITNPDYLHDMEGYTGDYMHIGKQIPAKLQRQLGVQIATTLPSSIQFQIDRFSQTITNDQSLTYMVSAIGTTYGSLISDSTELHAPFAVCNGSYAYIPYYQQGNLSELMMAYPLKDWLGVTREAQTYLLFKVIYPFSDLSLLKQLADQLFDAGIPFMVSARPVFENTDYPAMLRYLEALKYVQAKNGTILINAPVVQPTISQERPLKEQMESFIDVLADYGIAPLGIGAEMYWSYDRLYGSSGMGFFNSAILFPDETIRHREETPTAYSFAFSGFSLSAENTQEINYSGITSPQLPMDTMLTYDFIDDETKLAQLVDSIRNSWRLFGDYKNESHTVQTSKNTIVSNQGILTINQQVIDLNEAPKIIETNYDYVEKQKQSFATLFNIQNKIFAILILISLVVFGFLLIIGARLYKRKYKNQRRQ